MSNLSQEFTALIRDKNNASEWCLHKREVEKKKVCVQPLFVLGRYTDTYSSGLYQYQFRRQRQNESQAN